MELELVILRKQTTQRGKYNENIKMPNLDTMTIKIHLYDNNLCFVRDLWPYDGSKIKYKCIYCETKTSEQEMHLCGAAARFVELHSDRDLAVNRVNDVVDV